MIVTKSIATDFPNGITESALYDQIIAAGLDTITGIATTGDVVEIIFSTTLDTEQLTELNAVIAAHVAIAPPIARLYQAVKVFGPGIVSVTNDSDWESLDYVTSKPDFFAGDLSKAFCQLLGRAKVAGSGAKLRIRQVTQEGVETTIGSELTISDTGGYWAIKNLVSIGTPIANGYSEFIFQGKRGGATSFELRGFTAAICELI